MLAQISGIKTFKILMMFLLINLYRLKSLLTY